MYISEHLLNSENYENSKSYLKLLLEDCISNMSELYLKNQLDFDKSIKTISYINTFNESHNLPLIKFNFSDINYFDDLLHLIENYYNAFVYRDNTVYSYSPIKNAKLPSNTHEYDLIQNNINILRNSFIKSDLFDKKNRENILQKLESIQNDLNITMNDFNNPLNKILFAQLKNEKISLIEQKLYFEYKIKRII